MSVTTRLTLDAPGTHAAPLLWPQSDVHHIAQAELHSGAPRALDEVSAELSALARIADSIRSLQALDGRFVHEKAARALLAESSDLLLSVSRAPIVSAGGRAVLEARAAALRTDADHRPAAELEGALQTPEDLTVICGPMCTWRLKTSAPLHSLIAATRRRSGDAVVAASDRLLGEAIDEIRDLTGLLELDVLPPYPLFAVDLRACGGEANAFPKHFAYFLPEDEGVAAATRQKTLVFQNVYRERHLLTSRPLADAVVRGPATSMDERVEDLLLLWMRGHDVAHGMAMPSTTQQWRPKIGHEPYMMLQEAVADVFGFLLVASRAWSAIRPGDLPDLGAAFLAELLHYMRRGPWLHGDAGAAYLELAFLADRGYVALAPDGSVLEWDPDRLLDGILALALELAASVVGADSPGPARALLRRYEWRGDKPMTRLLRRLRERCGHVPTALAYVDTTLPSKVR